MIYSRKLKQNWLRYWKWNTRSRKINKSRWNKEKRIRIKRRKNRKKNREFKCLTIKLLHIVYGLLAVTREWSSKMYVLLMKWESRKVNGLISTTKWRLNLRLPWTSLLQILSNLSEGSAASIKLTKYNRMQWLKWQRISNRLK